MQESLAMPSIAQGQRWRTCRGCGNGPRIACQCNSPAGQAWGSQDRAYTAVSIKRHNRKLVAQRSPFDAAGGSACSSRLIELTEPLEGLFLSMPSLCSSPLFSSDQFSSPVHASSRYLVRSPACHVPKSRLAQLASFLQRKAT